MIPIQAGRAIQCPASPAIARRPAHGVRVDGPEART